MNAVAFEETKEHMEFGKEFMSSRSGDWEWPTYGL